MRGVLCTALVLSLNALAIDCRKAQTPREKLICKSPELKRHDAELNALYRQVVERATPAGLKKLRKSQRAWLERMDASDLKEEKLAALINDRVASLIRREDHFLDDDDPCGNTRSIRSDLSLPNGVRSVVAYSVGSCPGSLHPYCSVDATNFVVGELLEIKTLFKKDTDIIAVLNTLCEGDGAQALSREAIDAGASSDDTEDCSWAFRCYQIRMSGLALTLRGLEVNLNRVGECSCANDGEVIPWVKLKPYLDPNGPVPFALAY